MQIALKLLHVDSSLPDVQNLLGDIENRFLQEQWLSPQWTPVLGGPSSYVVVHMASGNSQLRLENTVMAWAAIFGVYGELNSTYQSDVQSMLAGTNPAWSELLQSGLCGSYFPSFQEHSDSGVSNDATATGADLLFMLGIVPLTATLAVPVQENSYEDIYNMLDPGLFSINLTTNVVTVSLATAGTLNFQFNQTVIGGFNAPGVYNVQFSSDWNTILSIIFVSSLPSNRQYVYTTLNPPPSYCISAFADSNSIISPSGSVTVYANDTQTFTFSAINGYTLTSVLVDGFSVPIIGSYTFTNVQTNHTISVESTINPVQITNVQLPSIATQTRFTVPINVTVTNSDSVPETAIIEVTENSTLVFNTTATLNDQQTLTIPCNFNVALLAIGNYTSTVTVTTTSQTGVLCTSTSTGRLGVTYLGDLNGDFSVTYGDLTTFVSDFVVFYDTPSVYVGAADYNHDGQINFSDLVLFVSAYCQYYLTQQKTS